MPRKKELLALLGAAGMLALLCMAFSLFAVPGQVAVVSVNGEVVAVLPLDADTVYPLSGNEITVLDGRCFVSWADCPDQVCVHQGKAKNAGQRIVCLPNKVIIEIQGGWPGADTVSY